MLNNCVLSGNLGNAPEMFYSAEGVTVASFNLAFKARQETCWIKIVCFKKLADIAEKYLHKGARIAVVGTLEQKQWEGGDGSTKTSFQIVANSIEFIKTDGRGFEEKFHENGGDVT